MTDAAIRVSELSKAYPIYEKPVHRLLEALWPGSKRHTEFWALRDVSFTVPRGRTIGIVGRNGSGKSTLLQVLAGTLTATRGTVEVDGRVAALLELGAGFDPEFTGRENVYNYGMTLGMTRAEVAARFADIVAFSEIESFIDQPVKTYSSGMFMRLAFAVAVHVDPEILIVDEALAVGDFKFQQKCLDKFHEFRAQGKTILVVSHSIGVIQNYCDVALWLHEGRQVAFDDAEKVARYYFNDFDGIPKDEDAAQASREAATPGSFVHECEDSEVARTRSFHISTTRLRTDDPLSVEWDVEVLRPLDAPNFGIAIESTETGRPVFATSARNDRFAVPDFAGPVRLKFDLPRVPLLRGRYMLRVTVTNTRGLTMYARVNQVIEVDHDGLEWGVVRLDVDYGVEALAPTPS